MNLSEDQLSQIEEYASNLMTWHEIAILLDLTPHLLIDEFMKEDSLAFRAYNKGKVNTLLEIRKSMVRNAKQGSPHSEVLAMELINHQKINETDIL